MEYIIAIYTVLLICVQYLLGSVLIHSAHTVFSNFAPKALGFAHNDSFALSGHKYIPFVWLFGLLAHLTCILLLKSLGTNWPVAIFVPLGLLAFSPVTIRSASANLLSASSKLLHVPFLIWLAVHCVLGVSLFSFTDSIKTPWVNNYGDLAFHLGMITHFVGVGDFPPSYHLYSEQALSYPFFINLWSAVLWWPSSLWPELGFLSLSWVFCIQWLVLWSCVYYFVGRGKAFFLPWVLLFGGGSYVALIQQPDTYSWRLIGEGYPWTTWLSTIWVTQRSALMGLVACLACCALVCNLVSFTKDQKRHVVLAGALLGFMPLVHTHYFVFTALFLGGYLATLASIEIYVAYVSNRRINDDENKSLEQSRSEKNIAEKASSIFSLSTVQHFLALFLPALFALCFFPFLLGKTGMAQGMLGWTVPLLSPGIASMLGSANMWALNAGQWGLAFFGVWWMSRRHLMLGILVVLFLVGNVVKLAVWDWDQIKVFLVIFTLFVVVWCQHLLASNKRLKTIFISLFFALTLCGPGVYEVWRIWQKGDNYQVYDPTKLALAELIHENTPYDAVIASPPDHNSAATLSGRTLFFGYTGTLASHSIDYRAREIIHLDLQKIRRCKKEKDISFEKCPAYIVWDSSARKYWHRVTPGPGFEKIASTDKGGDSLYKIIE